MKFYIECPTCKEVIREDFSMTFTGFCFAIGVLVGFVGALLYLGIGFP